MMKYVTLLIGVALTTPLIAGSASKYLSDMDYTAKKNAIINIEPLDFSISIYQIVEKYFIPAYSEEETGEGIRVKSIKVQNADKRDLIYRIKIAENYWNNGKYDKAINLINKIEEETEIALGISWKNPIYTSSLKKWGQDVQVTPSQYNMEKIELVKAIGNDNIFLVALGTGGSTPYSWRIFISTDGGNTWAETYSWSAFSRLYAVNIAEKGNGYIYIAYALGNNARIRRVDANTGQIDNNFSFITVFTASDSIKEVNIEPLRTGGPQLYYGAIDFSNNLYYYYTNDTGHTWIDVSPGITNADRGLDMDCGWINGSGHYLWLSYISTADSLSVAARASGAWDFHPNLTAVNPLSYYFTSIAMHGDTVIILYPTPSTAYLRYHITYNDGINWAWGIIYDTTEASQFDVTARGNEGWQVIFCNYDVSGPEIMKYRHRTYRFSSWDNVVTFGQQDAWLGYKSSIDYLGTPGIYGVAYINDSYDVYFNRMDWTSVKEKYAYTEKGSPYMMKSFLSKGNIKLSFTLSTPSKVQLNLYSAEGRKIRTIINSNLNKGNYSYSINNLKPGKYFLKLNTGNLRETKSVIIVK